MKRWLQISLVMVCIIALNSTLPKGNQVVAAGPQAPVQPRLAVFEGFLRFT